VVRRREAHQHAAPLASSLAAACERWAQRDAITEPGGETITYAELWRRAQSLAAAYERLGVEKGERVLCQLRNCTEFVVAIAACWLRGAIHVGADNDLTGAELARLAERFRAAALVFQPRPGAEDPLAPLEQMAAVSPETELIVHAPDSGPHHSLAELMAAGGSVADDFQAPLETAVLFLTSGTTGEPKAIIESRAAHWAKMQLFADGFLAGESDVMLLYLPISHVFGFRLALLTLLRGGRLVPLERFSPARVLELVAEQGVSVLPGVPAHLRLLRERFDPARDETSSLRWVLCAAARFPSALAEWVYDALRVRILYVYGCSEGFTIIANERADVIAGSVGSTVFVGPSGTPAAGTVAVVDPESMESLPTGETGEIVYGSRMPVHYWDTPPVATDGWYRTGDLGHIDAHGRVHVTGRLKELINRGGLHVSMAEVELALARLREVSDGAVIPTPDPVMGEAVCACVVPAGGAQLTLAELRSALAGELARHKLPDELVLVDSIPRTEIGKVDRRLLAAQVLGGGLEREQLRDGGRRGKRGEGAQALPD
jgi:acyl-CoA synthetase (AMP-forming)/AMP-acid ligase II